MKKVTFTLLLTRVCLMEEGREEDSWRGHSSPTGALEVLQDQERHPKPFRVCELSPPRAHDSTCPAGQLGNRTRLPVGDVSTGCRLPWQFPKATLSGVPRSSFSLQLHWLRSTLHIRGPQRVHWAASRPCL